MRYGEVTAIDAVDLEVRDGELLVLVGPSGCGKTTLLRTIAGLEQPTAGDVFLDGRRITDVPARKRDVAFVFQSYALFPHMTARENLSFNLRMQDYEGIDERVDRIADLLDLTGLLDRAVDELSGGQKQRVALGRAIATEPRAFLLDEPLANLDANLREGMRTEILRLQRRFGTTTIHVTHNQREALTMGDRIAVMRDGSLQQIGPPEEIYAEPANLFVARFVGSPTMNLIEGRYDPDSGQIDVGTDEPLGVSTGDGGGARDVIVGVRPEDVDIVDDGSDGAPTTTASVEFVEFHGADSFVFLGARGLSEIVARARVARSFEEGQVVGIDITPASLHVFDRESGERIEALCQQVVVGRR